MGKKATIDKTAIPIRGKEPNAYFDSLSVLTNYPKVSDLLQSAPEVAARLEAAAVGVNVDMTDGLLDPDAETQGASREGVEDVHKVSVVRRQAPVSVHPLKAWASRVQT